MSKNDRSRRTVLMGRVNVLGVGILALTWGMPAMTTAKWDSINIEQARQNMFNAVHQTSAAELKHSGNNPVVLLPEPATNTIRQKTVLAELKATAKTDIGSYYQSLSGQGLGGISTTGEGGS